MNEFDRAAAQRNVAREKKKKVILVGIVICIVLIVVLAFMIMYYQSVDAHTFKLTINGQAATVSDGFYFNTENGTYVRAKDIANYVGWSYQNGEYGTYTEDTNSGYIQNEYEVVSFVAGSNVLRKYIEVTAQPYTDENKITINPFETNSPDGTLETITLDVPVISQNGQIYFPLKHLNYICNASVGYDAVNSPYRMSIYSQSYLISIAQNNAAYFGYKELSGTYENMRLLAQGLMVVKKGSNFGVVGLYQNESVIGFKYTDMVFIQNVQEFFVKTRSGGEESVGIINTQGTQVVPPRNYSNIQILSDELGLYLVEKSGEYGVLDRAGETIVHCEYDNIGIPEETLNTFQFSIEDNKYMMFDNTIVVEDDDKYGFCDVDGTTTFPAYTGLGYIADDDADAVRNAEDVLTVEIDGLELTDGTVRDVKAIIVQQVHNGKTEYGIYDAERKKLILPCRYGRIYSLTSRGNTEYYIEFQGTTVRLFDQLAQPEIYE